MMEEIEPVMSGHYHIGGDLFEGGLRGPDGIVKHGNDIYAYDYKLAQEVLDEAVRSVLRAINTETKP